MKVKLLKKLRRRAHKTYGLMVIDFEGRLFYRVGYRKKLMQEKALYVSFDLDEAKKWLAYCRREMILAEVSLRKERNRTFYIELLNEKLKKL